MKIYLSVDMEGISGVSVWDEVDRSRPDWIEFRDQMTAEVRAACEGALAAGATECLVKDAHASARNVLRAEFPECVTFSRGWSGHPYCMMDEIDPSFDAALMIGYHSRAGSGGSPLAHTMSNSTIGEFRINGVPVSEFTLNAMTAELVGVPVAFVSGDEALAEEIGAYNQGIRTLATQKGHGASTISIHPAVSCKNIREGVEESLGRDLAPCRTPLPTDIRVEIEYRQPSKAYARSFYPGARLERDRVLVFETGDWFEVLRMILFIL